MRDGRVHVGRRDAVRLAGDETFLEQLAVESWIGRASGRRGLIVRGVDPAFAVKFGSCSRSARKPSASSVGARIS